MVAVTVNPVGINDADKQVVEALLVADTTPTTLPTTGAGIIGMNANQVFAPFSVLYVVHSAITKLYIADEGGAFIAQ